MAAAASSCIMSLSSSVTYTQVEEQNLEKKKDDDDDDYIELLLSRESRFCCTACDSSSPPSSVESSSRPDAVRWIVKTHALLGFSMKTAYLAVTYLDRFFKHRTIDLMKGKRWAIQLLSVACLSLAAKMEECKAAALPELEADYHFEAEAIQRMELLVLSTLGWRMITATPFPFLSYLGSKFRQHPAEHLVCRAVELIFARIQAINLVDYRASVVAAAAILAASDGGLTQQSLKSQISAISSLRSMDLDAVSACYIMLIPESTKEKPRAPKAFANCNQSAANCSSTDNSSDARNGAISSVAEANNKRREGYNISIMINVFDSDVL